MKNYEYLERSLPNAFFDNNPRKNLGDFYAVDTNVVLLGLEIHRSSCADQLTDSNTVKKWIKKAQLTIYEPVANEAFSISQKHYASYDFKKLLNRPNIRFVRASITEILELLSPLNKDLYYNRDSKYYLSEEDRMLIALSAIEDGELVSFDKTLIKTALKKNVKVVTTHRLPRKFVGSWYERLRNF